MATVAIFYVMPLRQREESMEISTAAPARTDRIMTFGAGVGEARRFVIRSLCRIEIFLMAGYAFIADAIPTLVGFVFMAFVAVEHVVCTGQRKPRLVVEFSDVVYQPVI